MRRSQAAVILVVAVVVGIPRPTPLWAQDTSDLAGRWTLNRQLSQFPREIGFGLSWAPSGESGANPTASGGRAGGGSDAGGAGAFSARRESEDDARRLQQLTAEVRNPPAYLAIVETPASVTITDDRGQSRAFHPGGKEEVLQLDGVPVKATVKREAGRLVVRYAVEQGRELRYTYSRAASPPQLVVDVQFIERGRGERIRRIYEPAGAADALAAQEAAPAPAPEKPDVGLPAAGAAASGDALVPASADRGPLQAFNQQPDAELRGLTRLGVAVEDLSAQAAACGLSRGAIDTAVSKRLSDAGFKVLRNSDEDTYVYVNVITTSLPSGFCISRYDAFLYTNTTAKLSYQEAPVLVQVSLLHKGGIAGSAPAAHGEAVLRNVQEYVDQFAARIRAANK